MLASKKRLMALLASSAVIVAVAPLLNGGDKETGEAAITSRAEARQIAEAYLGLAKGGKPSLQSSGECTVSVVTVHDSVTPFLSQQIDGNRAWRVHFGEVVYSLIHYEQGLLELYPKSITVVLDSATGHLLHITSTALDSSGCDLAMPSSTVAEKNMLPNERFLGFPPGRPGITFAQALGQVIGSPVPVKRLLARYLLYSMQGSEPIPAWTIYMYCGKPVWVSHGDTLINARCVIDANSGDVLLLAEAPKVSVEPRGPDGEEK